MPWDIDVPARRWMYSQRNSSFLGVRMLQRWVDLVLWENVLNAHQGLRAIIELGTGAGSFSIFLLLQALQRGMEFWTYDKVEHSSVRNGPVARLMGLGEHFLLEDVFDPCGSLVEKLSQQTDLHPLLLFCDGGDKPREFCTFVPLLRRGDLIGVHDWTEEVCPSDIGPVQGLVDPFLDVECYTIGSITRFWRRL